MPFMDQLRGLAATIFSDAERAFGRVTSGPVFERVVQAAFLIARADGSIDDSEKAALQGVIASKLPHFKAPDIMAAIAKAEGELAFSEVGGIQSLLANIAKSAGTDSAPLIMVVVLAVANADGDFAESEKVVARQIATRLGLNPSDYGL
jgi:tellurite resistance protein TerB